MGVEQWCNVGENNES